MGGASDRTLIAVRSRFAGSEESVVLAFETSQSFRQLCRDYLACAEALARWQEVASEEGRLRVAEYSELMTEISAEIEQQLRAHRR